MEMSDTYKIKNKIDMMEEDSALASVADLDSNMELTENNENVVILEKNIFFRSKRKKKRKKNLSNFAFNSLQVTTSTSTGIKRPQSFIDPVEDSKATKKLKIYDEEIQAINNEHLTRAIVSSNNMPLCEEQLALLHGMISNEISKIVDGFVSKFYDSYTKFGAIIVKCADEASLRWLSMQIDIIKWPEVKLKMIVLNKLQKYFRASVWIPGPFEPAVTVLKRLAQQNPHLNTAAWQIFAENLGPSEVGRSLFLGVPNTDYRKLQATKCKAFLGLGRIYFVFSNINVYQKYLDAVNLHAAWLNASENQSGMVETIVSSYNAILKEMKNALISSIVKYDFRPMAVAVLFLCQILTVLYFVQTAVWTTHKKTASFSLVRLFLCLGVYYFYSLGSTTSFYPTSILNALLFLLVIGILYVNCDLCINSDLSLTEFTKGPRICGVFQIGALLHIASFGGSSFIEEEHQTWYFLWTTTIAYLLYRYSSRLLAHYRCDLTSTKMRTGVDISCGNTRRHVELCAKLLLLLIGHRVLRKLNSTGDKWAHLPDIARWLKEDDSKVGMTLLLLTALVLLIWIAYKCEAKEYKWQSLFLNSAIAACIYFRHMSNDAVMKIPLYPSSSGIYEVQVFWGITALSLLSYGYRAMLIIKHDKRRFASTMLFFIVNTWVTVSAMLHQPYNVILLPMQIVASSTIDAVLRENDLLDLGILVHCWLGNVFYFYQGNSNSLASIDVAAGYVGLRSYIPLVTGVYLIVNTYSAPVLAYFLLVYYRQLNQTYCTDVVTRTSRIYIAWRLLTITVYMIIVTSQRHHLFVWSVFSPKLLYEATYSATMCCSALLALIITVVQSAAMPNYASYKN